MNTIKQQQQQQSTAQTAQFYRILSVHIRAKRRKRRADKTKSPCEMHADLVSIAAGCHRHHYRAAHSVIMCSLLRRAWHLHVCKQHWCALQLHPFGPIGLIFCWMYSNVILVLCSRTARRFNFAQNVNIRCGYMVIDGARFVVPYSDRSFTFHGENIALFAFVRFTRSLVDSPCTSSQPQIKLKIRKGPDHLKFQLGDLTRPELNWELVAFSIHQVSVPQRIPRQFFSPFEREPMPSIWGTWAIVLIAVKLEFFQISRSGKSTHSARERSKLHSRSHMRTSEIKISASERRIAAATAAHITAMLAV